MHKFMRDGPSWPDFLADGALANALPPQADADKRAKAWHQLWRTDEPEELLWPDISPADLAEIKMLDRDQFDVLVTTFPLKTGMGICGHHPCHWKLVSPEAFEATIQLWKMLLFMTTLPAQIDFLLIYLLDKALGGSRPVGVFPSVVRLLVKWVRKSYGEIWRMRFERAFFFGSKLRSVTVCSWRASAVSEYARQIKQLASRRLFDLVKAFENIQHQTLQKNTRYYEFSTALLKFLCRLYRAPRTVMVGLVATDFFRTTRTVVPGCSFADLLMRLAILPSLDRLAEKWPAIFVGAVVDDIQLLSVGDKKLVEDDMLEVSRFLIGDLHEAGLTIDTTDRKLVVLSNNSEVAQKLHASISGENFRETEAFQKGFGEGGAKSRS